jgi:hypothetical protein
VNHLTDLETGSVNGSGKVSFWRDLLGTSFLFVEEALVQVLKEV